MIWSTGTTTHLTEHPPCSLWQEVMDTQEIERLILRWNKYHLQQATAEEGWVHDPIMQPLIADQGCNNLTDQLLKGDLILEEVTDSREPVP